MRYVVMAIMRLWCIMIQWCVTMSATRQSVGVQCDGASQLAQKIPIITTLGMHFWAILLPLPPPYLRRKLPHRKQYTLVLKTTWKKLFLKYQDNAKFPSLCLGPKNAFLGYFYSKMATTQWKLSHRKKFTLVLKTTCKKLFLKYPVPMQC